MNETMIKGIARVRMAALMVVAVLLLAPLRASAQDVALPPEPMEFATMTDVVAETSTSAVKVADIIRVAGARVYLNRGSDDGVRKGMRLTVMMKDDIIDINGKVVGSEENAAGMLEAVEVHLGYSVAKVVNAGAEPLKRGMQARYVVLAAERKSVELVRGDNGCAPSMALVEAGTYTYYPPGAGQTAVTEKIDSFCIDVKSRDARSWDDALAVCRAAGKRLCAKGEYRKTCATSRTMHDLCADGACASPELKPVMEWTSDAPDNAPSGAGSCKCLSTSPSCAGCYQAGCPDVHFRFRCCGEAAEQTPEK